MIAPPPLVQKYPPKNFPPGGRLHAIVVIYSSPNAQIPPQKILSRGAIACNSSNLLCNLVEWAFMTTSKSGKRSLCVMTFDANQLDNNIPASRHRLRLQCCHFNRGDCLRQQGFHGLSVNIYIRRVGTAYGCNDVILIEVTAYGSMAFMF